MSRIGFKEEGNGTVVPLNSLVVDAEMVLNPEATRRIDEEGKAKIAVQTKAYADLRPALDAVASYQGKTAVVDFSIGSRTQASCGRNYCNQCSSITTYGIKTTLRGNNREDWTVSTSERIINYYERATTAAVLSSLKGIVAKTQDQRLAAYFERCKKASAACADPFLSSLVTFSKKRKLEAVAVRIDDQQVMAVSKEEMQEYSELSKMISYRYKNQAHGARSLRGEANTFLTAGILLPAAVYGLGWLFVGAAGGNVAANTFTTSPAVYGTLLAVMAVCIVVAIVLHVKAKQRLVADKVKYALPESVTVWQKERAQAKAGQESRVAKVEV